MCEAFELDIQHTFSDTLLCTQTLSSSFAHSHHFPLNSPPTAAEAAVTMTCASSVSPKKAFTRRTTSLSRFGAPTLSSGRTRREK